MPILRSPLKRMRADKKRRERNQAVIRDLKTRIRKFERSLLQKKSKAEDSDLKDLVSKINRASGKGVIHKNKASRLVSRLTRKANRSSGS